EITIEDRLSYGLTAGFGVTKWLSMQLDVGYFKGRVGPVDSYFADSFPISSDPSNPTNLNATRTRESSVPFDPGEATEIPVTISGIVRFRVDKTVNPYVGLGFGRIFSGVTGSDGLAAIDARLARLHITGEQDEFGKDLVPQRFETL